MARAAEHGLPVSKPWGEMSSYDFVIGKTGRFVSVQVKSTICEEGTGYECTVRGGHKAYPAGAFDFLAAFVVPADAWYFIPLKLIRGKRSIMLHPDSQTGEYEEYREAWHLLREAAEVGEPSESGVEEAAAPGAASGRFPTNAVERMEAAANFARRQMESRNVDTRKRSDDIDT